MWGWRSLDPGARGVQGRGEEKAAWAQEAGPRGSGWGWGVTLLVGEILTGWLTCLHWAQALGLAGLVGEAEKPEGEEEEEGEGPLCPEKKFLHLSDGALLLRVLGIM